MNERTSTRPSFNSSPVKLLSFSLRNLLSLAYYYLNDKQKALYYVNKALEFNKNNVRLNNNKEIFSKMN